MLTGYRGRRPHNQHCLATFLLCCCCCCRVGVWLLRWFFQQVVLTMDYFHRLGISHRDIKLENTLLKVGLWGLSGVSLL